MSMIFEVVTAIWQLQAENAKLRQELAIREASEQEKVIEYLWRENIDWADKYRVLAAENAKLHQQLADVTASMGRVEERCAKLRELVRDIYVDMWNCGEWLEPYEQRMQELGIEVDA